MDDQFIQDSIRALLENSVEDGFDEIGIDKVTSFEEAGLMTNHKGVIVRTLDGTEFQISIVRR